MQLLLLVSPCLDLRKCKIGWISFVTGDFCGFTWTCGSQYWSWWPLNPSSLLSSTGALLSSSSQFFSNSSTYPHLWPMALYLTPPGDPSHLQWCTVMNRAPVGADRSMLKGLLKGCRFPSEFWSSICYRPLNCNRPCKFPAGSRTPPPWSELDFLHHSSRWFINVKTSSQAPRCASWKAYKLRSSQTSKLTKWQIYNWQIDKLKNW